MKPHNGEKSNGSSYSGKPDSTAIVVGILVCIPVESQVKACLCVRISSNSRKLNVASDWPVDSSNVQNRLHSTKLAS